jgi:outer membrane protein OmpA-like peptidoglycan-associated protein
MSNYNESNVSPYWESFRSLWWIVALILFFLLLIMLFMGYGPNGRNCQVAPQIVTKTVEVEKLIATPDTMAPRLNLKGNSLLHIPAGMSFMDSGTSVMDNIDSNVSVKVTGKVDTNTPGEYVLTYTATDMAGNTSTETRTVIVDPTPDTTAPALTLNGPSVDRIVAGSNYVDAEASARDKNDGIISVKRMGRIDTNTPGEYILTYSATDAAGNTSTTTRKVIVEAAPTAEQSVPTRAKLYFENDSSEFPADTNLSLSVIISYLKNDGNARAVISGFHSPSGNFDRNQELSKQRAQAVSKLLQDAGVDSSRILLEKPAQTTGTGAPEEARRVEVKIQY